MSTSLSQTISVGFDVVSSGTASRLTLFSGAIGVPVVENSTDMTVSVAANSTFAIGSPQGLLMVVTNGLLSIQFTANGVTNTIPLTNNVFIVGGALTNCSLVNSGTTSVNAKIISVS